MADEPDLGWPNFDTPATKGDVVAGLVFVRTCILALEEALRALKKGDDSAVDRSLDRLHKASVNLHKVTDTIGGKEIDGAIEPQ